MVSANEVVRRGQLDGDFSWTRVTNSGGGWPSGFVHFRDVALRATTSPRVIRFAKVGSALRAAAPPRSPAATAVTYEWLQNGAAIPGATRATHIPTNAQLGKALSVRAAGTRYGYARHHRLRGDRRGPARHPRPTSNPALHGGPQLGRC